MLPKMIALNVGIWMLSFDVYQIDTFSAKYRNITHKFSFNFVFFLIIGLFQKKLIMCNMKILNQMATICSET